MSISAGKQIKNGFFWSFVENISLQVTRFIVGIIMARILSPSDYGLIGMLTVFIVISDLFVNSGIGTALNQKNTCSESDYSTAFIFNSIVGFICYIVLFFCAPLIADFYHEERLIDLLRWLSLVIIIKSFCVVPSVQLQIKLKFKIISVISFISSMVLGVSGIAFAYMDYGVWALVYSNIIGIAFQLLCYFYFSKWIPKLMFSLQSFRRLFGYGSRLLVALLIDVIYSNIYPLVIGRCYTASQLGYYSRAEGYSVLPTGTLSSMIYRVCFPVFCKQKDDTVSLIQSYNVMMKSVSYIIIPIMFVLLILAKPLVLILLTDKWLPCVPYLQVLCLSTLWLPIMEVNYTVIKALGNSKSILKMQLLSKAFAVLVLLVTLKYSVFIMCIGSVIVSIFTLLLNFSISVHTINQTIIQQCKTITTPVFGGICMMPVFLIMDTELNNYLKLIIGFVVALILYYLSTSFLGLSIKRMYYEFKNL